MRAVDQVLSQDRRLHRTDGDENGVKGVSAHGQGSDSLTCLDFAL